MGQMVHKIARNGILYHESSVEIEKPTADRAEYKLIKLENDLVVLLVSDPVCSHSSAAMNVQVGHVEDPDNLPGCAHFCEHLLLRGSKNFPAENTFQKILADNMGAYDAHTSASNTCYEFQIAHETFETALEIFADILVHPRFDPDSVKREVKAVHAEHVSNLNSDIWRHYQLFKSLSAPGHPFAKFGTGDWNTLWETPISQSRNPRDELLSWYKEKYSSNIMKLVISCPISMENLIEMTVSLFHNVPNSNREKFICPSKVWSDENKGVLVQMKSLRDDDQMFMTWPLPADTTLISESHILITVCNLLGHEGKGSIFSVLRKKGLCTSLFVGPFAGGPGFSFLRMKFTLTEKGKLKWKFIASTVMAYIHMLKSINPPIVFFQEMKTALNSSWHSGLKSGSPMKISSRLAAKLHNDILPYQTILRTTLDQSWDTKSYQILLESLNLQDCRVSLLSQNFDGESLTSTEPIYNTPYRVVKFEIDSSAIEEATIIDLHLPAPNEFITSSLELSSNRPCPASDNSEIDLISNCPGSQIWTSCFDSHTQANMIHVSLRSNIILESAKYLICANILSSILKDAISEDIYPATMMGYSCQIYLDEQCEGIVLEIRGSLSGLSKLAAIILDEVRKLVQDTVYTMLDKFLEHKKITEREINNSVVADPITQGWMLYRTVFTECSYSVSELLDATQSVTFETWSSFVQSFASSCHIESLVPHFNCLENMERISIVNSLRRISNEISDIPEFRRSHHVSPGDLQIHCMDNTSRSTSGIMYLLEIGDVSDLELRAFAKILSVLIKEPANTQLRNQEQLGYIVEGSCVQNLNILLLQISVESPLYDGKYLDSRIELFCSNFVRTMSMISEEEFTSRRNMIVTSLKSHQHLVGTAYAWQNRLNGILDWKKFTDFENIRMLSLERYMEILQKVTSSDSRRKISICVDPKTRQIIGKVSLYAYLIFLCRTIAFFFVGLFLKSSNSTIISWDDVEGYRQKLAAQE